MKKILATTFLSLGLLIGFAHAADKDDFQFGVRMGAQFSKVKGEIGGSVSDNKNSLVGPAFGFLFEIPVNAYLEIRPELNFGSQGQRVKTGGNVFSYWMGYVQVPVLVRGQYGNDKVRGFLQLGPQFGYGAFILSRLKMSNGDKEKDSYTFKDQHLKPFDAGLSLGVGAEFPAVKGIEIEARYYKGFSNISDVNIPNVSAKNQSISLTVAFKF